MPDKFYNWLDGAKLEEHSRRKHKILREYSYEYLIVRCQFPQQERFRLAIVDGFAGGGRYECGTPGSPIIFIEELKRATEMLNASRASRGHRSIEIECMLVLNDANADAIHLLKTHIDPLLLEVKQTCPRLHLQVTYLAEPFERAYPAIQALLAEGRYRNVLFNLDQCGDTHVDRLTILDIMRSFHAPEIFYTFMISSLLAFLQKDQPDQLRRRLNHLGLPVTDIQMLNGHMSKNAWLGTAERIVFDTFRSCAPYVSPFSINNPDGWRYWLIHFANTYRARQVYNNILHDNATLQGHFGRSGLHMLSYDPRHERGMLYLFDEDARVAAKAQLFDDIPQLVVETGDTIPVMDLYQAIYNATPAHADDISSAIADNPDIQVLTPGGGERRKANTIKIGDIIRLKEQPSFFPMFQKPPTATKK